jgi:hypothetical protein
MLFVHRIGEDQRYYDVLKTITDAAAAGDVLIVTSAFTLAEVGMVGTGLTNEEQEDLIVRFFDNPYIRVLPYDRFVAKESRHILRSCPGVKGKDAVHIATALRTPGLSLMQSYDKGVLNKNGRIEGRILTIQEPVIYRSKPQPPVERSLFDLDEEENQPND